MERILGIVGTIVFTSKTLYYVSGLGYFGITVASIIAAYTRDETEDFGSIVKDCQKYNSELSALT